jgi:2',3'-cyclic-nucleotide 2'-phosphodiesterase (5'-nucleotidase family)
MRKSLDTEAQEVKALKEIKYNAQATENYSLRGTRLQETPLGNLYADATLKGLKARAGVEADISMVHSGGIRADLYAGHEITRLDLSNVVMNAGRLEGEQQELTLVHMKGSQIKGGLEYSLRDMSAPTSPSFAQRMQTLLGFSPSEHEFDPAGNLMQVSGMRYRFDLRNPVGERITKMQVVTPAGRQEILPDQEYKVVTRFHPLDKWHKAGVFGDVSLQEAYENLKFQPLPVSQVDLLGDYIQGKTIDPTEFSAVEGRIKNRTPQPGQIPIKLGSYQSGIAAVTVADPHQ